MRVCHQTITTLSRSSDKTVKLVPRPLLISITHWSRPYRYLSHHYHSSVTQVSLIYRARIVHLSACRMTGRRCLSRIWSRWLWRRGSVPATAESLAMEMWRRRSSRCCPRPLAASAAALPLPWKPPGQRCQRVRCVRKWSRFTGLIWWQPME